MRMKRLRHVCFEVPFFFSLILGTLIAQPQARACDLDRCDVSSSTTDARPLKDIMEAMNTQFKIFAIQMNNPKINENSTEGDNLRQTAVKACQSFEQGVHEALNVLPEAIAKLDEPKRSLETIDYRTFLLQVFSQALQIEKGYLTNLPAADLKALRATLNETYQAAHRRYKP